MIENRGELSSAIGAVSRRPTLMSRLLAAVCLLVVAGCSTPAGGTSVVGGGEIAFTAPSSLQAAALASGRPLRVVATTSIIGDVIGEIAAGAIDLRTLMPLGVDPHTYEPTPRDIEAIAQADVVFLNGLGLEEALLPSLANAGGQAAFVSLSEGIPAREMHGDEDSDGHEHGGLDPHVWHDPANVIQWSENAAEALSRLDPAGEAGYRQRAGSYRVQLEQLDSQIRALIETIPAGQRKLVTDHDALGYFADRYGFAIVGAVIPAYSTSAEPSAQDISRLEDAVKELGVKAVFVGVEANQALSNRVAQDTGVRLVPIYAASLSPPDGPAPSYIRLMLYNVNAIVGALK